MEDLISRRIILHPITNADLVTLHEFRNRKSFIAFCTNRKRGISIQEFYEEINNDFQRDRHFQCLILRKQDHVPMGTIFSHCYNKDDKYTFVTTFIDDTFQRAGYGAEAVPLFLSFLFRTYKLYKIYMDVYEYNNASLSAMQNSQIFCEEGRFKKQKRIERKRYDVIRFACYRKSLQKISDFLVRINKTSPNERR